MHDSYLVSQSLSFLDNSLQSVSWKNYSITIYQKRCQLCIFKFDILINYMEPNRAALELSQKRESHRVRIRKQTKQTLLRQRRTQLLQHISSNSPPTQSVSSLFNQTRQLNFLSVTPDLIQTLQHHWQQSSSKSIMAILANLLVDNLSNQAVELLFGFILPRLKSMQFGDIKQCAVVAFLLNGLFRKYRQIDEEEQEDMEEVTLPLVFGLLQRTWGMHEEEVLGEAIQEDVLECLVCLFRGQNDLDVFGRVRKNGWVLVKLVGYLKAIQTSPKTRGLQLLCLSIYGLVSKTGIKNAELFNSFGEEFIRILLFYLQEKLGFDQHQKKVMQIITNVLADDADSNLMAQNPEITRQVACRWSPNYPFCLKNLVTNFREALSRNNIPMQPILSDLREALNYETNDFKILTCLQALYEILAYDVNKEGPLGNVVFMWRNIGGVIVLESLENRSQNQEILELIARIIEDTIDLPLSGLMIAEN